MTELDEETLARIHQEAEEIRLRVMTGARKPRTAQKPAVFSEAERERRRLAALRFDHDEILRLYVEEGLTSAQIAEKMGMKDRKTAVNVLKKRGVWKPAREGKGGRPLSDFCERGHDQEIWRRESTPGKGDWHCGACKNRRNAEWKKKQAEKRRINRLEHLEGETWSVIVEGEVRGTAVMADETALILNKKLEVLSRRRGIDHRMDQG